MCRYSGTISILTSNSLIHILILILQLTVPEFTGPHFGARMNKTNKREFTPDQEAKARINAAMPSRQTAGSAGIMERTEVCYCFCCPRFWVLDGCMV